MRTASFVVAGTVLLLAGIFAPGAQARVEGFQSLASSPAALTSVATDPGSGLVYAQENSGTKFFVYDPRTNAWTELAPSPIDSGNNGGAAYLGGKLYLSFTGNGSNVAVYDIASNTWTTIANPLGAGTADITTGNGRLYMAVNLAFVAYDPTTGITTPLAEPPKFAPEGCHEGFEPWGGLQFVGGKIYGHQGDGCNSFAVYDVAANSWRELPLLPEVEEHGGVAGSAFDPVTMTYLTYGPYSGKTVFRYDLEAGSWTTGTMPFEVADGGLAYVALAGFEGIYMVQGESGTEFTRYTEQNATDLSASMSSAVVGLATGGTITYSIQVKNNGPERAGGVVLSDPLPAGTTLLSAVTSLGACAGTSAVTCTLGALPSGASATLTIKAAAKGFKKVTNTATVSSKAVDGNPANNSATVVSTVPEPCKVPELQGLRPKAAKKALRAANCKPGKVVRRFSGKVDAGRVIRGSRHSGKVLPAQSKIKLTVSRGAKQKGPPKH